MIHFQYEFNGSYRSLTRLFASGAARPVPAKTWQGVDIEERPEMVAHELEDVCIETQMMNNVEDLQKAIQPNLPWAEDHFQERVSGIPHNPPPSDKDWPFAQQGHTQFKKMGKFSHTYPERLWPKLANGGQHHLTEPEEDGYQEDWYSNHTGIRYEYGDLSDVVNLLLRDPYTRQAYVPIWFPEDTGVVHGERVPCTLGYHVRYRRSQLDVVYYIRSCDFRRHLRDDVYMACRLGQWVSEQLQEGGLDCHPGKLVMHISGLHVFAGDLPLMKAEYNARLSSSF